MNMSEETLEGLRTDCITREVKRVTLRYKIIVKENGEKVFQLIGGPTGYESFCIEQKILDDIKNPEKEVWVACMGDIGYNYPRYDRLEVPLSEMRRIFEKEGLI